MRIITIFLPAWPSPSTSVSCKAPTPAAAMASPLLAVSGGPLLIAFLTLFIFFRLLLFLLLFLLAAFLSFLTYI